MFDRPVAAPTPIAFLHYRAFPGGTIPRRAAAFLGVLLWRRFRGRTVLLALTAIAGNQGEGWTPAVAWPLGVVGAAWLLSAGFNRLRDWVDLKTAPELRFEVQTCLFSYLIEHAPQFFQDNFAGRLAQKIKQAGQAALALLGIVFNELVRIFVAIIIGVAIVGPERPGFALLLVGWTVAYSLIAALLSRRGLALSKALSDEVSASTGVMVDVLTNADLVRAFSKGPLECLRAAWALDAEQVASRRIRRFFILMWLLLFNALLLFQLGLIALAVNEAVHGRMSVGDVVMVSSLAGILGANVMALSGRMLEFYEQLGVLESALDTVLAPHAITDRPEAKRLVVARGEIRLDNLSFRHSNGTAVFAGLSLTIRPGEKVGLVGPSGSGKSTLIRLLRRQYEAEAGRILIDGQDITGVTLDSLNDAIAEVPQMPGLFHRSIEDNLRYARPDAAFALVTEAAAKAHCLDFIEPRPSGWATIVGEQGIKLSGGERQRVAIARAFLKDARILILDEATSALDSETEHLIRAALWELFEGRTVIAIAHRLSTIVHMDRILYLEKGRVLEEGSHDQLLAQGGRYARLWQRQADGFIG